METQTGRRRELINRDTERGVGDESGMGTQKGRRRNLINGDTERSETNTDKNKC